jgi:hypothetical protein
MQEEIRKLFRLQKPASLEEAQIIAERYMRYRNQMPHPDFHSLSPLQMHRFLYFPFDSDTLVSFPSCLSTTPDAPILTLFSLLVDAIGEQGMKPTATGNLPRNFCREAALAFWGAEEYEERTRFGAINTEPDFPDLNVTRVVAEQAGLIRKYKGRFTLCRKYRVLIARQGPAAAYPLLLKSYFGDFNWAYRDHYPEFDLIQASFLFTLYLLDRYGDQWRPHTFYEDHFLQAFPVILEDAEPRSFETPEETVRGCYSWRCLRLSVGFLGLIEIKRTSEDRFDRTFTLKKRSLLGESVIFHL